MSRLLWNVLKAIPVLLGANLLPANSALAEPQTTTKPIAQQLTSVSNLQDVQPAELNTADNLTPKASVLQVNAQLISQEAIQGTTTVPVAQTAEPEPNNAPSNSDYIGIGGSIGISGDKTALGSGGLAILSKNRLTDNLSLHSTNVLFGSRTAISTFALTFGIPIRNQSSGQVLAFPFVGGGLLVKGDFDINGLVAGGVDVPVSENLTATAQVNVGFLDDDTDVGLQIGLGYNFRLF
ncbi:hypothetical protein SD81_025725 [Tolypothrix campylonemoides VB511288]|nr:hypothetical protein SD81_025725 [Tolypothrix campylonemoides VB511288]